MGSADNTDSGETLAAKLRRFRQVEFSGDTFLFALVCAYVVLVPTLSFAPSLHPYNEKRVLQIGVLLVVAGSLLGLRSARQRWLASFCTLPLAARWGLGGVLGLGLLSSTLAPSPFYAFLEVGHFALLFVAVGAVASEVRRAPRWTQRALLGVVAASAGLYAVYFAAGYGAHLAVPGIKLWPDGGTNYANIRFFNHYQTWTLPLLVGGFLSLPRRWRTGKGGMFGLISLWWALVFASNVRGTVLAMGVAAVGVGLLFRRRSRKWIAVLGAGALGGLALHYALFAGGTGAPPVVDKFGNASQYPWRIQRWITSLELAWAHPWIGAGPMHFAWPLYRFAPGASPHNALMQWLSEWGFPSTFIMVGLTTWGGWKFISGEQGRTGQSESLNAIGINVIGIALVGSLLAGATHTMVSGLIVAPLSQMCLVLVGGWAWGRYQHADRDTARDFSARSHVLLGAILLASAAILGSSLGDLSTVEERRSEFFEAMNRNKLFPRYWAQGYIGVRDLGATEIPRQE